MGVNRKQLQRVRAVATGVRKWAELRARQLCSNNKTLECLCAVCSGEISKRLAQFKISHTIAEADIGHVFILVDDYVVDVTAQQFSRKFPKVIVRKRQPFLNLALKLGQEDWWAVDRTYQSKAGLRRAQKKRGWPAEQVALP